MEAGQLTVALLRENVKAVGNEELVVGVSMFSRDNPDAVQMANVWVPLDMLVVLPRT